MSKKKKKKNKKRVDLDVRPIGPWFKNYDYGGPEAASKNSPGRGLYEGPMDKYKSVKEFIDKKRKERKKAMTISDIIKIADEFEKSAQDISTDMSLVDSIKQAYGNKILNDIAEVMATKAVSSVNVRIAFDGNKAGFVIQSVGSDAAEVGVLLTKLLNKKYAAGISSMITRALKGKKEVFEFGLMTVQ